MKKIALTACAIFLILCGIAAAQNQSISGTLSSGAGALPGWFPSLHLGAANGITSQCIHADTNGNLTGTGSDCSAGGSSLAITATSANANEFPLFATGTSASASSVFIDTASPLNYNPSTGTVSSLALATTNFTANSLINLANSGQLQFNGINGIQSNGSIVGTNPIQSNLLAEYPMTETSGTVAHDISVNANNANFCTGATPSWTTYGLALNNTSTAPVTSQCLQTTIKTWHTAILSYCGYTLPQSAAYNVMPFGSFPTLLGAPGATGIRILGIVFGGGDAIGMNQGAFYPETFIGNTSTNVTEVAQPLPPCGTLAITLDTNDHFYVNGVEQTYVQQGSAASAVATTSTGYLIGSGTIASGLQYTGVVPYAMFYSDVKTPAQIAQLTSYVEGKVKPRVGYPTYPSSTSFSPQVICAGDSLTCGLNSGGTCVPWCPSVAPTNSYTYSTWGVGSDTAYTEVGIGRARFITSIAPRGQKNYVNSWYGTNDTCVGGNSAAVTWTYLNQIGADIKAKGGIPIIQTMISRTGCDTQKNALNALIRANYTQNYSALNDTAAIPILGADGASTNTACFVLGVHLTPAGAGTCLNSLGGYGVIAANLTSLINVLDGNIESNPTVTTSTAYVETYADNFVLQTPASSATITAPVCSGLTGIKRKIINGSGSNAITFQSSNSENIIGSTTIAANTSATYVCELVSASAGGGQWVRQ